MHTTGVTVDGRISVAAFAGLLLWGVLSAAPAIADEFEVGVVIGDDVDESEFLDGFQLAVDESPDISHPPDTEGGDHLGSMDVVMVVVSSDGSVTVAGSSPIVVADVSADALDAVTAETLPLPAMLVLFTDTVPSDLPDAGGIFAITRTRAEEMASDLSASFESDFTALHGYRPSPDATRGYTAGKLVDVAVEATDRDPMDTATLRIALDETVTGGTTTTTTPPEPDGRSLVPPGLIAVIAVVLAIVAAMYIRDARRKRPHDGP